MSQFKTQIGANIAPDISDVNLIGAWAENVMHAGQKRNKNASGAAAAGVTAVTAKSVKAGIAGSNSTLHVNPDALAHWFTAM
jgi:hypothetical protein